MRHTSKRSLRGVFVRWCFFEALVVIQGGKHTLNDVVILSGGGSDAVKLCSGLFGHKRYLRRLSGDWQVGKCLAQRRRDIADEVAAGGVVTGSRKEMLKSRKQMKFIISFFDRVRRMKKIFSLRNTLSEECFYMHKIGKIRRIIYFYSWICG